MKPNKWNKKSIKMCHQLPMNLASLSTKNIYIGTSKHHDTIWSLLVILFCHKMSD